VLKKWMQYRQFGLKREEESDGANYIIGILCSLPNTSNVII